MSSVLWEFSIISNEDDSFAKFLKLTESNKAEITLDTFRLARSLHSDYPFNVFLRFSVQIGAQPWYDFGLLKIVQPLLHANISGPKSAVKGSGTIYLNASGSYDPETGNSDGMKFSWTCRRRGSESCPNMTPLPDDKVLRVNVNRMESNVTYTFMLTVGNGSRISRVSHELTIEPAVKFSIR